MYRLAFAALISFASHQLLATELKAIQPAYTNLVKLEECVEQGKILTRSSQTCASLELNIDLTQIPWLDAFLLEQLNLTKKLEVNNKNIAEWKADLANQAENWIAKAKEEIKADKLLIVGREYLASLRFVHQRYNLVTFKLANYSYIGGAHGMGFTNYFVLDLHTEQKLDLTNILQAGKQADLAQKLLETYSHYDPELAKGWFSSEQETLDNLITNNFFFNEQGLNFVYPPYALAPYSYGEVTLTLPYYKLTELLVPEHQLEIH